MTNEPSSSDRYSKTYDAMSDICLQISIVVSHAFTLSREHNHVMPMTPITNYVVPKSLCGKRFRSICGYNSDCAPLTERETARVITLSTTVLIVCAISKADLCLLDLSPGLRYYK